MDRARINLWEKETQMLTVGARTAKTRWWPSLAALLAMLLAASALGGCVQEAEDQCYVYDNPVDTDRSSVCTGGEEAGSGSGSSSVTIVHVATINENVVIINTGLADQDMTGWSLENEVSGLPADIFPFPAFTLLVGEFVRVHSIVGTDDADDLFWDGGDHWDTLDSIALKDDVGNTINTCGDGEVCWDDGS